MGERIDPRVDIGHVHLKVADLDRAIAFYGGVLGFDVVTRWPGAAFLSAGGYHHHIGLNTWESAGGSPPLSRTTGLYHVAIRYPDRAALGDALKRLTENHVRVEGASDHGVSEALYLRDPDGNGLELYWDRPKEEYAGRRWQHRDDQRAARSASVARNSPTHRPQRSVNGWLVAQRKHADAIARSAHATPESAQVLLDDARAAHEMDRGRIASNANLLQLVINDPWFAWLHPLSELVVRIDETIEADSPQPKRTAALSSTRSSACPRAGRERRAVRPPVFRSAPAPTFRRPRARGRPACTCNDAVDGRCLGGRSWELL